MVIYFYKADAPYGCFSNFSPHPICLEGCEWPTVEHYYQAHKLLGTPDEPLMSIIRKAVTPEEAAAIGRNRARTIRADWSIAKRQVMWDGVLTKFLTHSNIQAMLLATGDDVLVENSPRDSYWGCGRDGTGHNALGELLMRVRQHIRHHPEAMLS
ncbi:conserved hypothetical protein, ribA/ribD-fused [Rubidibacter lacunae KORDI 51-2]|uniref:NADAR domain-containing protein n=1 Tax=Rubidibacter lacunae KORDI 51-2 TaxID=582515 RepID=U5DKE4_9CHRO|nr:NADAR family protein [Rubidibacter lacunae]ERN42136.1 conserved hypothetical protein, ribA/ribD-fused [Rubidibacter lacunae KORDI 51-2]